MTLIQALLSLLCISGMSIGQILFKLGAPAFISSMKQANLWQMTTNGYIITAIILYGAITFLWIYLLDLLPLKIAYPMQALAFFIVPILSWLLLGEKLALNTFIGATVIVTGVFICIYR